MSDKDTNKMNDKELRNEVQLLRDELAIFKRKYEDLLYNLDYDNFSSHIIKEKDGMKTQIDINEKGISTLVTDVKNSSEIAQTAYEISMSVADDLNNYSTITQTNNKINMLVSKSISATFVSDVKPTKANTTDEQKGMLCEYNGEYYYYNNISSSWEKCPYQNEIKSLFEQTPDGFNLVGDVSVKGRIFSINEKSYAKMSNTGLEVYVINGVEWTKKIGIGYYSSNYDYPYIILGAGTNEQGSNKGCVYKLGEGLWIGDAYIVRLGGKYPGGAETLMNVSDISENITGIFIDLNNEKIYQYIRGVPSEIGSGGSATATFG
jgi:hypothetical protein